MKVDKKELKNAERDLKKLQQSEVYSNYYEFQRVLGEGAFCTVYQALDLETGEVIAVKVSSYTSNDQVCRSSNGKISTKTASSCCDRRPSF